MKSFSASSLWIESGTFKNKIIKTTLYLEKKIIQRSTKVVIQIVAQRSCGD